MILSSNTLNFSLYSIIFISIFYIFISSWGLFYEIRFRFSLQLTERSLMNPTRPPCWEFFSRFVLLNSSRLHYYPVNVKNNLQIKPVMMQRFCWTQHVDVRILTSRWITPNDQTLAKETLGSKMLNKNQQNDIIFSPSVLCWSPDHCFSPCGSKNSR